MKKNMLFLLMFLLIGCSANVETTLKIKYQSEELIVGDVVKLETNIASVTSEYKASDIIWASSNDNASVTDGVVIALKEGEVIITASVGNYKATKTFVINPKPTQTTLTINGLNTVIVGNTLQLETIINKDLDNSCNWKSSDETIATISQNGLLTAHQTGLVKITAISKISSNLVAEHMIYVKNEDGKVDYIKNEIINVIYELEGDFDLTYINEKTVNLVNNNKDAVVGVSNYQYGKDAFGKPTDVANRASIGTGAIYQKQENTNNFTYTLLTNYHVIEKADFVKIYLGYLDKEVEATVVKSSPELDLAIVTFTDTVNINPLKFASLDDFNTSDFVVAIGNSNGYEYFGSVTFGIISEKERRLTNEDAIFIQHTAAINPGNSGGPLFSLDGKIIGINTLKIASMDIDNMGFAVSLQSIINFLE